MESKLSSLYNRIRRSFKRRTAEAPSRSKQLEREFKRGKDSPQPRIRILNNQVESRERQRELTRQRAQEILELMEEMEKQIGETHYSPRPGRRQTISRVGMLRIVMGTVAEIGMLPQVDLVRMEQENILNPQELMNLRDIMPMAELMLQTCAN
ncbi:C protein [Jeilongvirus pajuense]|uniref:C protein n=1 Tax=Jeilongvirus sp. TaxID=2686070 RepID=A0A8F7CGI0_9MONO|nr:C protein [Jeilongvirus sp.]